MKKRRTFTPYPSQNDIGYKFQTETLYKSAKQKLFKETAVTNYPEISSQIFTDKNTVISQDKNFKNKDRKRKRPLSSWIGMQYTADINQRTSLIYNTTNYKWNTSKRSTVTENQNDYSQPTTRSYFDKMTSINDERSTSKSSTDTSNTPEHYVPTTYSYSTTKNDQWNTAERSTNTKNQNGNYFSTSHSYQSRNPSVLVLERESKLNRMLQQMEGEVQLLRIYLQEDPGTSTYADTFGTSTFGDTIGSSTFRDTIGTSDYTDTVGTPTYADTHGPSTIDGVNKIVKDYWYL